MDFDTYVRQLKTLCSRRNSPPLTLRTPHQAGFTLVELMITVVIVGIFVAIAVPSFGSLIRRQNVNSAANELYDLLQYARGEAVTQARGITIAAANSSNESWNDNITVASATATLRQIGSDGLAQGVAITTAVGSLTFSATGNASAAACFQFTSATDATVPARFVGVQASGRITPPSTAAPASGECN